MEPIIELKNADISQGETLILKNIDLKIDKGEFIYLVGRVGTGKTSLLKALYHEIPIQKGSGYIMGYFLHKIKEKEVPYLRRRLGMVFQDFSLLKDRSIYKNFDFVLRATGWNDEKAINERIDEVLNVVNMSDVLQKMPHQLSGGEQQRIMIARALLNNPEIILADEPTGNLDPETSASLLQMLTEINKEGKTILIATHDYAMIQKYPARRILFEGQGIREVTGDEELIDFESLLDDETL